MLIKLGIGAIFGIGLVAAIVGDGPGGKRAQAPAGVVLPPPAAPPVDTRALVDAALRDLTEGKSCEDRLEAVRALRRFGDRRALAPLKKARYRMRGGVLGIGDSNTNACLKAEAEAAIEELE
jgi:hypothetical protein